MNIKVFQNRKIEKDYFYNEGTQNENKSTVLTFEVPLGYEDFSKRIVFITENGNFWDYIPENKYEIKNNITKYGTVEAYLWLTKDEQDFRSQNFELNFYDNENADDMTPSEEQVDGFNTLIAELDLKIAEVEELKNTIYQLQENVDNALIELDKKQQNYEQRFQNIDNKLELKLDEVKANPFVKNVQYDNKTATFTFTAYDNTQIIVDLPIEGTVKDGGYDPETQELYLVLVSGQEIRIPVTDLVNDYEGLETATIQILISADNKITANIKGGSITENLLSQEVAAKLNKVIDLTPYITKQESYEVFYTKQEVDEMVKEIQETNEYQSEIIDQFKNEFKQITLSGDSIYISDAAELPMELVPYGKPVQEVIPEELGTTLEGESVVVTDGDVDKEVKATVNGNSYQETTDEKPSTSIPSDIEVIDGVNRLDIPDIEEKTENGITYSVKNGVLKMNGTSTTAFGITISKPFTFKKGTYTHSIFPQYKQRMFVSLQNTTLTMLGNDNNSSRTFTLEEDRTFINYLIWIQKEGVSFDNEEFTFQVSEGTEIKPYLPYGHIGLKRRGKNYFNKNNSTENKFIYAENGVEASSSVSDTSDYIPVKANKKYLVTYKYDSLLNTNVRSYCYFNTNKKYLSGNDYVISEKKVLINPTQDGYIKFSYDKNCYDIQVEDGEVATEYEPYIEPIVHSIDLAGNKLAKVGEIADLLKIARNGSVKIGDKVIKEYVFTGDEIWGRFTVAGSTTNYRHHASFMRGLIVGSPTNSDISNVLCNMLIAKSPNQTYFGQEGISIDPDGTIRIYSNKTKEMTTDEFKNWLKSLYEAGTPLRILYETTEPTTIELPSIEPITLFEGTNVFELVTNLGTTMEVTYNYVTPSPSIDRPSEILTVEGSYSTELQNEYATITNTLPLTLTNELLGEIVTLTEEEAKELNLDGAGKYRRTDWIRVNGKDLIWFMNNSPIQNKITNRFVAGFANNAGDANIVSAYCNILKRKTPNQIWNEDEMAIGQTKSEITIRVPIELTTNADVRAFFEKNNGYILLKQNPVYEKITDETELQQLSAYDKQVTFFGVNNINTFPTDDLVKAPLKIHATYSKSNKLTIQSLEDRLASLESQVTNLQDNQI